MTRLYQMVNVPTSVWIDERGKVVRPPEVAYSKEQVMLGVKLGDRRYIEGLKDWVKNGEKSAFVMPRERLEKRLAPREEHRKASAHFRLGAHFHKEGKRELATKHWEEAQKLDPENWNYHRQDWSFDRQKAGANWFKKYQGLKGRPYYDPLELPEAKAPEPKAPEKKPAPPKDDEPF